ncbi:protein translocase subunit SecD [Phycicoccus sp. CSK15P-2]|uniref:protein translocase subunit SecD n=1 Tax=Phycicoccus sp. CSK15P-2 TaxID=2807627 RepID=UPI00194DDEDB|nr:protein translocase subunit SecD [Phycicoccus sp. CSK15P-2]MBM6403908.1 protein translocase subunit SecD [Phycicoccus sp. CSK15P-2]
MARGAKRSVAARSLIGLVVLVVGLGALLAGANIWSSGGLTPKLGLDLKGGTQLVLEPRLTGSQTVSPEQLAQARDIIVQRVDSGGVSGAEVTTQGDRNIVVSIPEVPSEETKQNIQRSSQMQFRPVLQVGSGLPAPTASPSPSASASGGEGAGSPSPTATAQEGSGSPSPTPTSTSGSALNEVLTAESPSPSPSGSPSPSPSPSGDTDGGDTGAEGGTPTDPTDLAWVTPEVQQQFDALECTDPAALDDLVDDDTKPLVTCSDDGVAKYVLGPVAVSGASISDATAGYRTNQQGALTSEVEIALSFDGEGTRRYADISREMVALPEPQNQMATVLDSRVIVAPRFTSAIPDGNASITGGFTLEEARNLAEQLKFGALPLSFDLQTSTDISPTLGSEQLRYGLIAGLIGLLLVVVYSVFQYRMLGFVTIFSLATAAGMTYLVVTILGWSHNYRLDMAGVTGLIVAIGFTADSFIVYFERVRDELREGRSLAAAVETGWARARRTILAADGVNFLAALVLYTLATSNVRGFAFTLGLTTLIDLVVVYLFTHPVVALLARRPFFRDGHPWSGLDPRRLGVKTTRYAGRGRFTSAPPAAREPEGSHA